jgi:glycosyltransferase involved in cell wall biosynthesis
MQQRRPWQQRLAATPARALDPEWVFLHVVDFGAARAMDRIVVLDRKNKERVAAVYGKPSTVVRSGVDADFFSGRDGAPLRVQLDLEGAFVLAHVGYAAPWKGQSDALRALKAVAAEEPRARLVLVGQAVRSRYEREAAELGVLDRVTFLEGISDTKLAEVYAACDALLFPANQTWGLNVTEAMAAGKPTVVSDAAGVAEVLEDGKTGFVVPHGDVRALADRALALARDEALARRVGQAGRAFVREALTWRRYAEAMVAAFEGAWRARYFVSMPRLPQLGHRIGVGRSMVKTGTMCLHWGQRTLETGSSPEAAGGWGACAALAAGRVDIVGAGAGGS